MFRKLVSCFVSLCAVAAAESSAGDYRDVFALLDLDRPGLEKVKADCGRGQWRKASADLLEYYRTRQGVYIPGQESRQATAKDSLWADDALEHTFHVLDKPVWNYGRNIDWTYRDGNAGMRIVVAGPEGSTAAIDRDWYSEAFHEKKERPVIRLDVQRKAGDGVQRFVTVIYPFDGDNGPDDRTMENIEISKIIAL